MGYDEASGQLGTKDTPERVGVDSPFLFRDTIWGPATLLEAAAAAPGARGDQSLRVEKPPAARRDNRVLSFPLSKCLLLSPHLLLGLYARICTYIRYRCIQMYILVAIYTLYMYILYIYVYLSIYVYSLYIYLHVYICVGNSYSWSLVSAPFYFPPFPREATTTNCGGPERGAQKEGAP